MSEQTPPVELPMPTLDDFRAMQATLIAQQAVIDTLTNQEVTTAVEQMTPEQKTQFETLVTAEMTKAQKLELIGLVTQKPAVQRPITPPVGTPNPGKPNFTTAGATPMDQIIRDMAKK